MPMRARKCQKVRYGHRETAQRAIKYMLEKGRYGLSEYECARCGGWHIGHRRKDSDFMVKVTCSEEFQQHVQVYVNGHKVDYLKLKGGRCCK